MKRRRFPRLKKLAKIAAAVLVVVLVAAALAAVWLVRRPWTPVDGAVEVAGLSAPVEIVRDRWGVPHVSGATEADVLFGQGWVHAQDRLWQMEFNRLVASGRLASVLGAPLVETDRTLRTLGLRRAAERDWRRAGPRTREMLEAYSAGVNAFLGAHGDRLPLEFTLLGHAPQPWTPVDSLAWGKLMALNLSLNQSYEVLRLRLAAEVGEERVAELLPPYPADGPVIVPGLVEPAEPGDPRTGEERVAGAALAPSLAPSLAPGLPPGWAASLPALAGSGAVWGSNSWAVHGSRTASGRPILANDTHLGLQMPSTWYENGLHGGGLDTVGFSFPGLPLVVIGQNRRIAWGITNMCSDVQDLFVERLDDPEDPRRYLAGEEWRSLERVEEVIEVKGGEPVTFEVLSTRHGPLIHEVDEHLSEPTALAWTAYTSGERLIEALHGVGTASDWPSFRRALEGWTVPSVNFTYADVDGNIGYQGTGLVPVRPPGDEGLVPKPGWTGDAEWTGFIPYDEMPRSFNPPTGYLVTANNRTTGDDYPHHIAHDMADPYRARRIEQVLSAERKVTVEAVRALQADVTSIPAAALAPRLAALADRVPAGGREARALALLDGWRGDTSAESAPAALFQVWLYHLWPAVWEDDLGDELVTVYRRLGISQVPLLIALMDEPDSAWFDDRRTPEVEDRDAILLRALGDALDWLEAEAGADPAGWRWGDLHTMTFAHAPLGSSGIAPLEWVFNSRTVRVGGDVYTVNEGMPDLAKPFRMVFGPSQRYVADLSDLGRSLAVNSTGQSGQAFHRHRQDQVEAWAAVGYHPVLATPEAAEAAAEARLRLLPGGDPDGAQ